MRIDPAGPKSPSSPADGSSPPPDASAPGQNVAHEVSQSPHPGGPRNPPAPLAASADATRILTAAAEEITLAHQERAEAQKRMKREGEVRKPRTPEDDITPPGRT